MKSNILFDSTIAFVTLVFLSYLTFNDYQITTWMSQQSMPAFTAFMNQSVFQKGSFGASDIPILLDLLVLLALFAIGPMKSVKHRDLRIGLYFLITSQLLMAVIVHSLKISWGRARPFIVFAGESTFAPWYKIGSYHFIGDGMYSGSFPSGHTVMILTLFSFYLFFKNVSAVKRNKMFENLFFAFGLVGFIAMAASRTMSSQHWITDTVASFILSGCFLSFYSKKFFNERSFARIYNRVGASYILKLFLYLAFIFITIASAIIAIEAISRSQLLFITPFLFSALMLYIFRRLVKSDEKVLL